MYVYIYLSRKIHVCSINNLKWYPFDIGYVSRFLVLLEERETIG